MPNPYAALGLAPGASLEECKMAFRRLAKTCHPDLHPNDPQAELRFKELNAAYDAITNPQPEPQPPPNPWNFRFNFDPGGMHGGYSPFDDLFNNLRHGQSNVTYEARITLEDVFHGKQLTIQLPGHQQEPARDINVQVPPGIEDGMRLVVQNADGRARGDVHILIRVVPHQRFTRQGWHLTTVAPVTAFDVLLGNEVEVVGIDAHTMRVAIPRSFDSTRKLRLAGQGLRDGRGTRGDLLVDLYVQYPPVPDAQRTALQEIASACRSGS